MYGTEPCISILSSCSMVAVNMKSKLTPEEVYILHRGLVLYFNSDNYDFFKYGGKARGGKFEEKSEKFKNMYAMLTKKKDIQSFIIANILRDNAKWVVSLITDEAEDHYNDYRKKLQSLSYSFREELTSLRDQADSTKGIFMTPASLKGQGVSYPTLIMDFLGGRVSIFTMVILNDFFDFVPKYDKKYGEHDLFWGKVRLKVIRMKNFFEYDREKFIQIAKDVLK